MNINDGIAGSYKRVFCLIIQLKYLFAIIKLILIICIYLTYDENIFSGLSILDERLENNYMKARAILLLGITIFGISCLVEIFILLLGFTFNFNKNNAIILSLNIFSVYLLLYFIVDNWHYVTIWYIFVVAQFPQTVLESYGLLVSALFDISKYQKMKNFTLKPIKSD